MSPRAPESGHTPRWGLIGVALLVTGFIIFGSLYPFVFHPGTTDGGPVLYLLGTWTDWDRRGDLLSNILLYLPFGFFTVNAVPSRVPLVLRVLLAIFAGAALSTSMELAQYYDADRVTSMGDVYANVIGSSVGAITAAMVGASVQWPFVRQLVDRPDAAMLLITFLGYRLYPYVPVIDLHKYWHVVRDLLQRPVPAIADLTRFVVIWLFIAAIIDKLYGLRRWLLLFPLFALGTLGARVLIVDLFLSPGDVAGAVLAGIIWVGLLRWLPIRWTVTAALFAGLVVTSRLEPFSFASRPLRNFGWVPFWSMMHGSVSVAMQAFLEKFYQYGGSIWLCNQAGVPLVPATGLISIVLFGTSYAEIYLPERSGEITDAIMAFAIGMSMILLIPSEKSAQRQHACR